MGGPSKLGALALKASEAQARPTPVEPGLLPHRHFLVIRICAALFQRSSRIAPDVFSSKAQSEGAFASLRLFRPDGLRLAAAFAVGVAPAVAHDLWSNGKPVPGWIKSACCGEADAHRLRPDQVRQNARGDYVVQGYHDPIAAKFALPSADGDYWIFYRDNLDGSRSAVFCFFVPIDF